VTDIDPLHALDEDDDDPGDPPPDRRLTKSEEKLQRWVDLLAALLVRHLPVTFDELAADVPGYELGSTQRDSVMRTFERDKDELRRFGVPIETVPLNDGETSGYRLNGKKFYLPFLVVSSRERGAQAARVRRVGYRSLETLVFEPEELEVIAEAAARVRTLGDPLLAEEAQAAIRKLALDLPLGAVAELPSLQDAAPVYALPSPADVLRAEAAPPASEPPAAGGLRDVREVIVPPRRSAEPAVFERLSDALSRRKVVSFDYYTIERDERTRRTVEPYGLFFVSSHWYLVGRDRDRDALRNFRLTRISRVEVNPRRAQSADYAVPPDFVLREHARAREPWEIGDGDARTAIVEFTATTGATEAARKLGRPVTGDDRRRAFDVRRDDAFARWLLSFGGDARPVAPPELVAEFTRQAEATLRLYAGD
jgi:predicted DNA-binding transcriptional regulator YafY